MCVYKGTGRVDDEAGSSIYRAMQELANNMNRDKGDIDPHPIEITGDVDNTLLQY